MPSKQLRSTSKVQSEPVHSYQMHVGIYLLEYGQVKEIGKVSLFQSPIYLPLYLP